MEITTNNTQSKTAQQPNPARSLSTVLWALSHMIENEQVTRQAPALLNVLEEIEGFDSHDVCTLRHVLIGHAMTYGTPAAVPIGLTEPVTLWEHEEMELFSFGNNIEHEAPFADPSSPWNQPTPPADPNQDSINEVYLLDSQLVLLERILKEWHTANGQTLSNEETAKFNDLLDNLYS